MTVVTRSYHFRAIDDTPFSVGVVIPEGRSQFIENLPNVDTTEGGNRNTFIAVFGLVTSF